MKNLKLVTLEKFQKKETKIQRFLKNLKAKDWVIVALVIIIIGLMECRPKKVEYIDRTLLDSIIVRGSTDTIIRTVKVNRYVDIPKPTVIKEIKDTCLDLKIQDYKVNVSDSLISGDVTARVLGELKSLKLDYEVCVPTIYKTDSVFTYKTVTKYKQPTSIMFGGQVGGNQKTFMAGVNVGLLTPKGLVYEVQYNFTGNTVMFGIKKAFKLQK